VQCTYTKPPGKGFYTTINLVLESLFCKIAMSLKPNITTLLIGNKGLIACTVVNFPKEQHHMKVIKTLQNFTYKTYHIFEKCTKILKTRHNLKDVKLTQTTCQKLSISTTNRL
jgi:hypothetical protein